MLSAILLLSINVIANPSIAINHNEDFDPLIDVSVTIEIKAIRFLEAEKTEISMESSEEEKEAVDVPIR